VLTTESEKKEEHLKGIVSVVEPKYINALMQLHRRVGKERFEWAVGGDLGEALRTVEVKPDCIEILTSKRSAAGLFLAVKDCNPTGVYFQTEKLLRKAEINGKEYPVYARSHYFEFSLADVRFKVHGDLQLKIGSWEWGDRIEFVPEYIYIVGVKTALVPLQVKHEIYQGLGWFDRVEKINHVLSRRLQVQVPA
jgi:hypothetical protein